MHTHGTLSCVWNDNNNPISIFHHAPRLHIWIDIAYLNEEGVMMRMMSGPRVADGKPHVCHTHWIYYNNHHPLRDLVHAPLRWLVEEEATLFPRAWRRMEAEQIWMGAKGERGRVCVRPKSIIWTTLLKFMPTGFTRRPITERPVWRWWPKRRRKRSRLGIALS